MNTPSLSPVIRQKILAVVSGEESKSEALGIGEDEFVPWPIEVAG